MQGGRVLYLWLGMQPLWGCGCREGGYSTCGWVCSHPGDVGAGREGTLPAAGYAATLGMWVPGGRVRYLQLGRQQPWGCGCREGGVDKPAGSREMAYCAFSESKSLALCKTSVSPLLTQWRYHSLAHSHWNDIEGNQRAINL